MIRKAIKSLVFTACLISSSVMASVDAPFGDLVDVNGEGITNEANLGDGKWKVVMIWATDCHICAIMKPRLSKFHDKNKDTVAEVYGIALDGHDQHEAVKKYMIDHDVSFPTFIGEFGLVAANFEINSQTPLRGTPTYLLFNPEGELLAIDFGMLDVDAIDTFIGNNT